MTKAIISVNPNWRHINPHSISTRDGIPFVEISREIHPMLGNMNFLGYTMGDADRAAFVTRGLSDRVAFFRGSEDGKNVQVYSLNKPIFNSDGRFLTLKGWDDVSPGEILEVGGMKFGVDFDPRENWDPRTHKLFSEEAILDSQKIPLRLDERALYMKIDQTVRIGDSTGVKTLYRHLIFDQSHSENAFLLARYSGDVAQFGGFYTIPNGSVSRVHAMILFGAAGVFVQDLFSLSGTSVNEELIYEAQVFEDDTISMPSVRISFTHDLPKGEVVKYPTMDLASLRVHLDTIRVPKNLPY
ncbi:MAG: FHA domain-containing protein [Pseudomonadota bacterium]